MPPDGRLDFLSRDFLPLTRHLSCHHHRRGPGQARGFRCFALVFFPGPGNGLHLDLIFLAQPGQDLLDALSGQAAGIVQKNPDFEQCLLLYYQLGQTLSEADKNILYSKSW